ncbi:MAG: hypothetical protein WDO74_13570 [Pseudomonadota bacterium]
MMRRTWLALGLAVAVGGCSESKSSGPGSSGAPASGVSGAGGSGGSGDSPSATGGAASPTGGAAVGGSAGVGGKALDPSVLTQQLVAIDELQLDASRVYWLEGHNRILSIPLDGGTPSVVYASSTPGKYEALHIAIDASKLYFTDQGVFRDPAKPRGVFSIPLDGSAERTQLITTTTIDNLTVADGYLYFTANDSIVRMSTSGGAATALVRNINTDTPLAVHDGYVYFWYAADATVMQNIFRVSVDSDKGQLVPDAIGSGGAGGGGGAGSESGSAGTAGSPAIAAEQLSNTTRYSQLSLSPRVDEGYVYWSIYDELYRYPVAGGSQEKFGVLSKGSISLLLVDHGHIYWGGGSLQQFVVGGDSNTNVVTGIQGINALAVNDSYIFVADGKLLRRIARP